MKLRSSLVIILSVFASLANSVRSFLVEDMPKGEYQRLPSDFLYRHEGDANKDGFSMHHNVCFIGEELYRVDPLVFTKNATLEPDGHIKDKVKEFRVYLNMERHTYSSASFLPQELQSKFLSGLTIHIISNDGRIFFRPCDENLMHAWEECYFPILISALNYKNALGTDLPIDRILIPHRRSLSVPYSYTASILKTMYDVISDRQDNPPKLQRMDAEMKHYPIGVQPQCYQHLLVVNQVREKRGPFKRWSFYTDDQLYSFYDIFRQAAYRWTGIPPPLDNRCISKGIFYSKFDSGHKTILNFREVEAWLKKNSTTSGIEWHMITNLLRQLNNFSREPSFTRELKFWSQVDVLISPQGAHELGMLWAPRGSVILSSTTKKGSPNWFNFSLPAGIRPRIHDHYRYNQELGKVSVSEDGTNSTDTTHLCNAMCHYVNVDDIYRSMSNLKMTDYCTNSKINKINKKNKKKINRK